MDKILIKIHSMVDIITNSSTELFVLDTDKSVELVKEILQDLVDFHNKIFNTSLAFEDVFDEPYNGEPNLHKFSNIKNGIIVEGSFDNSIPHWMLDFIEEIFGYSTERFHLG